jgi:hypothetical protein
MTIQTAQNDPNNWGDEELIKHLRTLWLGIRDDLRTFLS